MIKLTRLFLLLNIFLLCYCESQGAITTAPNFQNNEEAIKSGCKISQLKTRDVKNCVLETFDGHDLILTVYDSTSNGHYIKAEQFRITSWHNEANVRYEDLLGQGIAFIIVEFEGNTGTGTLQKILAIIGWHNGRFAPVLIEPLSYYIDSKGLLTDLKVDYEIQNQGTDKVALSFHFSYSKGLLQKILKYDWHDTLSWNNAKFSFYDQNILQTKIVNSDSTIQEKILRVRVKVADSLTNIKNLDLKTLEQLTIMQILD